MILKNKKRFLSISLLVGLLTIGLTSCGGGGGGGSSETSEPLNVLDKITQDLELVDGEPLFDEEVEITMWTIIGEPDLAVQRELIDQFNEEYLGMIKVTWNNLGHFEFYNNLETTWSTERDSIPDILFMHNEKTIQYAGMDYLWPLDDLIGENTGVNFDFTQTYENIDRVAKLDGTRYAIPVDAHGFVTSIRQDIIKKNGLGFEGNTRFIPESRAEYQELLEGLREKADANELWVRDINAGSNHAWKKANPSTFYPSFMQSTDPDGLSALYANGGTLLSADQKTVTFQNNKGFETYLTDQVDRYNDKLMGPGESGQALFGTGNTVMFPEGPWYVSQQFTAMYNNAELTRVSEALGVTADDASDPIYSKPYVASKPLNWWTLEENMNEENDGKWYGNGHAISITKQCTSMKKVAAALIFAQWYTQGKDMNDETKNNLTTWCSSGHIPAWKNVYEADDYQEELSKNVTLQALGDPADIIAMEGLLKESTVFNSFTTAISSVQTAIKDGNKTHQDAINTMNTAANSLQAMLSMLEGL